MHSIHWDPFWEDFNLAAADKHEWMVGSWIERAKILYEIEIWHVGVEGRESKF